MPFIAMPLADYWLWWLADISWCHFIDIDISLLMILRYADIFIFHYAILLRAWFRWYCHFFRCRWFYSLSPCRRHFITHADLALWLADIYSLYWYYIIISLLILTLLRLLPQQITDYLRHYGWQILHIITATPHSHIIYATRATGCWLCHIRCHDTIRWYCQILHIDIDDYCHLHWVYLYYYFWTFILSFSLLHTFSFIFHYI